MKQWYFFTKRRLLIIVALTLLVRWIYVEIVFAMFRENFINVVESSRVYDEQLMQKNELDKAAAYQAGMESYMYFDQRKPFFTKKINGVPYAAYPLLESTLYELADSNIFIIHNGERAILSSTFHTFLNQDSLFDGFQDVLLVVNSQFNSIDEYMLTQSSESKAVAYKASYKNKIYNIGTISGISCEGFECSVKSAFHQESGCDTIFNYRTKQFSTPVCVDHNGSKLPLKRL